jgi:hypothetical protein
VPGHWINTFGSWRLFDRQATLDSGLLEVLARLALDDLRGRMDRAEVISVGPFDLAMVDGPDGWTVLRAEGRGLSLRTPPLLPEFKLFPWWKPS